MTQGVTGSTSSRTAVHLSPARLVRINLPRILGTAHYQAAAEDLDRCIPGPGLLVFELEYPLLHESFSIGPSVPSRREWGVTATATSQVRLECRPSDAGPAYFAAALID